MGELIGLTVIIIVVLFIWGLSMHGRLADAERRLKAIEWHVRRIGKQVDDIDEGLKTYER